MSTVEDGATVEADVAIVGGGMVGAALGALLVRQGRIDPSRVVVLERERPQAAIAGSAFELRVSAISRASERILRAAGAWPLLDTTRVAPYQSMRVWHEGSAPDGRDALSFDAAAMAERDLGAIIENRNIQVAALQAFEAGGGRLLRESLQDISQQPDAVLLRTSGPTVRARLVVGADGAASRVREAAGITAPASDYGERAIVATVACELPHGSTAWQVFLSTGPLALLPLADGHCSLVWSAIDDEAARLLALDEQAFNIALTRASARVLGSLQVVSERRAFPLRRMMAARFATGRCVLVGDAAHTIHPLAGQGVNQGLLDAAALCEAIADRPPREDPAAPRLLRRYERERRAGNAVVAALMDQLDAAFRGAPGLTGRIAREGLGWVGRSRVLREALTRQALGLSGDLPRYARG